MRRVIKKPTTFMNNINVDDMMQFYKIKYPKGKQPTKDMFTKDGEIDLTKLTPNEQLATLRAQLLSVKIWYVETEEDASKVLSYITHEAFKYVCFDTETTNIKTKNNPEILLWSITVKNGEAFVIPYMFNDMFLKFFTTTEQTVVAYNLGFDGNLLRIHGGKFPKNFDDPYLYNRCLYNDTVSTPPLSLKAMQSKNYGNWSDAHVKSNITDLTKDVIYDEDMLYYSGIDSIALFTEYNKSREKIENEIDVDIFDLFPSTHPTKRGYSREYFYKNVLKQLLPLSAEFTANGLPLNMDKVHQLDAELDNILGKADMEVLQLPTVMKCWEEFKHNKATAKKAKYLESVDAEQVKIYKSTNQQYINLFVETMYPDKVLPSKAKNWTPTVISTFDVTLANAIKDKDLERLRDSVKYENIFTIVEDTLTSIKVKEKTLKIEETSNNMYNRAILDLEFKPLTSSEQKKYIFNKGYGIRANNKSMITGEDSFNKEELARLAKEVPKDTELYKYIDLCIIYSGGAIIKQNFVKNFKEYTDDNGRIHASVGIGKAKSYRPTSSGKLNLLNLPSSRSVFSKPVKRCIEAPKDWIWMTADYSFLEIAANAIIVEDKSLVKILLEGRDQHCHNSAGYYKEEIESILGPNDGTVEWNHKYKEATKTNARLNKLRSNSKAISFSLQYLSGVPGLYKAVGYLGDTFEGEILVKDYMYTTDITVMHGKDGKEFFVADKDAKWLDVTDYKDLDVKYHNFFETAVIPAARMHNSFHNELYADNKVYREEKVIEQAKKYKNVHLGMGAYINQTKKLDGASVRTLWNANFQFYSILTLIAMEKFRRIVESKGLSHKFQFIASVYDSVYFLVKRDKELIKWASKALEEIMTEDFVENQKIKLNADVEIGPDWSDFTAVNDIENLDEYLKDK